MRSDDVVTFGSNEPGVLDWIVGLSASAAALATVVGVTFAVSRYFQSLNDARKTQARMVLATFTKGTSEGQHVKSVPAGEVVYSHGLSQPRPGEDVLSFCEGTIEHRDLKKGGIVIDVVTYRSTKAAVVVWGEVHNQSDEVITRVRGGVTVDGDLLGYPTTWRMLMPGETRKFKTIAPWSGSHEAKWTPVMIFTDAAGHTWRREMDHPVKLIAKAGKKARLKETWRWPDTE